MTTVMLLLCRLWAIATGFSFVALASAGIAFTPHPDTANAPSYFSGTNSRASYHVEITTPSIHLQAAQLLLNGELVISRTYPILGMPPKQAYRLNDTLPVMFDSSHFAHAASIEVKCRAQTGGVWYEHTYTVTNKNRALLYNHPGIGALGGGDGSTIANSLMSGQNYDISHQTGAWTPTNLFSDMTVCDLLYINTHGATDIHEAGDTQIITPWDQPSPPPPFIPGYEQQRQSHIGTGLPPFNSTANPAINLFLLEACESGTTNNFIRACWPYRNYYSNPSIENQAFHSYTVFTLVEDTEDMADVLFTELVAGHVIDRASAELVIQAQALDLDVSDTLGGTLRYLDIGDAALYGDTTTRIKSVYTGTSVNPVGWYR